MKRLMAIAQTVAIIAVLIGFNVSAEAQPSADELKRSVQERSQKIDEYRALLSDPDQSVRVAALDVMLKSDDIVMRELAYGVGFSSTDEAMRGIALKNKIADLETIVIKIERREDASENEKKIRTEFGGTYAFDIKSFDEKTGRFETKGQQASGKGQVAGTAFDFSQQYCNGTFRLGVGAVLKGTLGCRSHWEGEYAGTINLQ